MEYKINTIPSDVWVVSDNIISSLGFTTDENIEAMLAGRTGIVKVDDSSIYPHPFQAGIIDKERLNQLRTEYDLLKYSLFESLLILSISASLDGTTIDLSDKSSLLIVSTTKGDINFLSGRTPPEKECYLWHTAQRVASHFHMNNTPLIISSACISGVAAVEVASRLLRRGIYQNIIVAGADSVSGFTVSGFQSFRSVSSEPCKPYDKDRDGLSIGEGAASIILTNNKNLLTDSRKIRVSGGAISNDANHISGPSRTGDGLHYAIENAIRYAGISHQDIDFMNLHGTATIFNDEMESKAIRLSELSHVPVNSLKGYWGHTLGASGIMEIIACIESLKRGQLIATHGFSNLGVPEPLNVIKENSTAEIHTLLKTASGFGGLNAAVILSDKEPVDKKSKDKFSTSYKISTCCTIKNACITINGIQAFNNSASVSYEEFIKSAFKNLQISYPKFYRMDNLSKLGFIAVRYLLKEKDQLSKYDRKNVSLLFSNSGSSLDTDIRHQQSINDPDAYFPSPGIFVYTLPNIALGEICIKEKIQGEVIFFISEHKDQNFIDTYLQILFDTTNTDAVIAGRIEYLNDNYDASIFLIEKTEKSTE